MVLNHDSPENYSVRGSVGSMATGRPLESVRSGYVLAGGEDPVERWYVKFIRDVLFCGCLCRTDDAMNVLTETECAYLEELRLYMEEPFIDSNPDHEMLLTKIWTNAFPQEVLPAAIDIKWTNLGFQSSNPRTDIRTGVHSLLSMEYMSRTYPLEFRRIVSEAHDPNSEYPFAASCVSISFSLLIFFKLNTKTSVNPSGCASGTRYALKQFIRLSMSFPNLFDEIFSRVTMSVHKHWMNQLSVTEKSRFDIHYFGVALTKGLEGMTYLFNEKRIKHLADLKNI